MSHREARDGPDEALHRPWPKCLPVLQEWALIPASASFPCVCGELSPRSGFPCEKDQEGLPCCAHLSARPAAWLTTNRQANLANPSSRHGPRHTTFLRVLRELAPMRSSATGPFVREKHRPKQGSARWSGWDDSRRSYIPLLSEKKRQ